MTTKRRTAGQGRYTAAGVAGRSPRLRVPLQISTMPDVVLRFPEPIKINVFGGRRKKAA